MRVTDEGGDVAIYDAAGKVVGNCTRPCALRAGDAVCEQSKRLQCPSFSVHASSSGFIYLSFKKKNTVLWQAEAGYDAWNAYAGDLAVLRATGVYTQAPGSNDLARQDCGLTLPQLAYPNVPQSGTTAFFLVTGLSNGQEGDLGTDSAGNALSLLKTPSGCFWRPRGTERRVRNADSWARCTRDVVLLPWSGTSSIEPPAYSADFGWLAKVLGASLRS